MGKLSERDVPWGHHAIELADSVVAVNHNTQSAHDEDVQARTLQERGSVGGVCAEAIGRQNELCIVRMERHQLVQAVIIVTEQLLTVKVGQSRHTCGDRALEDVAVGCLCTETCQSCFGGSFIGVEAMLDKSVIQSACLQCCYIRIQIVTVELVVSTS